MAVYRPLVPDKSSCLIKVGPKSSAAMQEQSQMLPDYEKPPVVETILGVQFDPLPKFRNAHLGSFWKSLDQEEWPTVIDAPPLEPVYERFGDSLHWSAAGLRLKFSQDVSARLQIRNRTADRMIQVQNGRLHFNWLGRNGGNYPRYHNVREGFERAFTQFVDFCKRENVGTFLPNQWEVTYLNHIPKGTVWNSPEEWNFFRPLSGLPSIEGVAAGESFQGEWHFAIPDQRGRLHVQWQHAMRSKSEAAEIIVLTLTARGPIPGGRSDAEAILEGLDLGRETIVRSFRSLMSDTANKFWGLKA